MEKIKLRVTGTYHNVCTMDAREVNVVGIILNLHVKLAKYPDIDMLMDVVVIDVPDNWGMLLSRKWAATLGGYIQMDWTYSTILASKNTRVILHREKLRKQHVENPKSLEMNLYIALITLETMLSCQISWPLLRKT